MSKAVELRELDGDALELRLVSLAERACDRFAPGSSDVYQAVGRR